MVKVNCNYLSERAAGIPSGGHLPSSSQLIPEANPARPCYGDIGRQPRRAKARYLGSLRNSASVPFPPTPNLLLAFLKQNVAPCSRRHNASRNATAQSRGQDSNCFGACALSKSTPTRHRGQHARPQARSTASEPGLHPVLATPPWRAYDPLGSQRRKLRLAGGEKRSRSGVVCKPRGGRSSHSGSGSRRRQGPHPSRGPAGRRRPLYLELLRRGAPASALGSAASVLHSRPLGSGQGWSGCSARAPRPAPRAHFLVPAPNSLLLALRPSRPPSLPSPGLSRSPLFLSLSPPASEHSTLSLPSLCSLPTVPLPRAPPLSPRPSFLLSLALTRPLPLSFCLSLLSPPHFHPLLSTPSPVWDPEE